MLKSKSYGILSNHCLSGGSVSSYENALVLLKSINCSFLEVVKFEWVFNSRLGNHLLKLAHIHGVYYIPFISSL